MKKQSGFTLIELVIVIIILGILAATAVPKFVDLQGDARSSAIKGVKAALEGAATLTYSRAAIDGTEKEENDTANGIPTVYGYPAATKVALEEAAGLSEDDWSISENSGAGTALITAYVEAIADQPAECSVTYTKADSNARPTITVNDDDC